MEAEFLFGALSPDRGAVDLRVTDTMLEVYRNDERLTSHHLLPAAAGQDQTQAAGKMSASDLPEAIETQDESLSMGLGFEDRLRLIVDEPYSSFPHFKVTGLVRRRWLLWAAARRGPDPVAECLFGQCAAKVVIARSG